MPGFRNIDATPNDPVMQWGFEGLLAAIERGSMRLWDRIAIEIREQPYGAVARLLEDEVIDAVSHAGARELFRQVLARARRRSEQDAKLEVANRLRSLLGRSGMSQRDFAAHLGTSASRLNTYINGKVTPAADLLVRAERIAKNRPGKRRRSVHAVPKFVPVPWDEPA